MRKHSALFPRKALLILSGILAAAYLGLCVGLRLWQTRLIFFPPEAIAATPANFAVSYEEVWIPVAKQKIYAWWIPAATKDTPVLLYLHGNSSNIGDIVGRALLLDQLGSLLLIDYRGYGRSVGSFPTEKSVYEDAEAAWTYLTQTRQIAPEDIVIYGHSLGGAIAIELAHRHPEIAGVIVEGTFTSVRGILDNISQYQLLPLNWILTQHFDSLTKVRSLQTPILFIHGTKDKTVPTQMSQQLYAAAPQPKQLLLLPDAGHNNIASLGDTQYLKTIQKFINQTHTRLP